MKIPKKIWIADNNLVIISMKHEELNLFMYYYQPYVEWIQCSVNEEGGGHNIPEGFLLPPFIDEDEHGVEIWEQQAGFKVIYDYPEKSGGEFRMPHVSGEGEKKQYKKIAKEIFDYMSNHEDAGYSNSAEELLTGEYNEAKDKRHITGWKVLGSSRKVFFPIEIRDGGDGIPSILTEWNEWQAMEEELAKDGEDPPDFDDAEVLLRFNNLEEWLAHKESLKALRKKVREGG